MLEVKNITKHFGEIKAVESVSFSAQPGQIFGLLGPNGAGKTTTIRMIMNIIAPDSGEILFGGKRIEESDKDRIGYLPEERGLYRKVKAGDMLLYLAGLKNSTGEETARRLDQWLERFDLLEWKDKPVESLSKGMSQKAQFIASVLHDPEFIFLDEPFAGLDPVSTDALKEAILDLGKSGKTILFSTHIMEQAEKLCSYIFIINKGREVLSGTLEGIKNRFGKKSVVIEFDGSIDFLKDSGITENILSYPRWVEVDLAEGKSADDLLKLLAGKISVRRFEVVTPSLHRIFIQQVKTAGNTVE